MQYFIPSVLHRCCSLPWPCSVPRPVSLQFCFVFSIYSKYLTQPLYYLRHYTSNCALVAYESFIIQKSLWSFRYHHSLASFQMSSNFLIFSALKSIFYLLLVLLRIFIFLTLIGLLVCPTFFFSHVTCQIPNKLYFDNFDKTLNERNFC